MLDAGNLNGDLNLLGVRHYLFIHVAKYLWFSKLVMHKFIFVFFKVLIGFAHIHE